MLRLQPKSFEGNLKQATDPGIGLQLKGEVGFAGVKRNLNRLESHRMEAE